MSTFQVRPGVRVDAERWFPGYCPVLVKTNEPLPWQHPLSGAVRPYGTFQGDRATQLVKPGDYLVSVDGQTFPVHGDLFDAVFREKPSGAVVTDRDGHPWGDKIVSRTDIGFSFLDRLRLLFRGELEVTQTTYTEFEVGRVQSAADILVSPVWRKRRRYRADGLGCQAGLLGVSFPVTNREDVECNI
jgi:hypothetical protein